MPEAELITHEPDSQELRVRFHHFRTWFPIIEGWYNGEFSSNGSPRQEPWAYSESELKQELFPFALATADKELEEQRLKQTYHKNILNRLSPFAKQLSEQDIMVKKVEIQDFFSSLQQFYISTGFIEENKFDERLQNFSNHKDAKKNMEIFIENIHTLSPNDSLVDILKDTSVTHEDNSEKALSELNTTFNQLVKRIGFSDAREIFEGAVFFGSVNEYGILSLYDVKTFIATVTQQIQDSNNVLTYSYDLAGNLEETEMYGAGYRNKNFLWLYKFFYKSLHEPNRRIRFSEEPDQVCESCRGGVNKIGSHCTKPIDPFNNEDLLYRDSIMDTIKTHKNAEILKYEVDIESNHDGSIRAINIPIRTFFSRDFQEAVQENTMY